MTNKKISKFEAYTDEAQNKNVNFGESADTAVDMYNSKMVSFTSNNRQGNRLNSIAYINQSLNYFHFDESSKSLTLSSANGSSMTISEVNFNDNIAFTLNGVDNYYAKVGSDTHSNEFTFDSQTSYYFGSSRQKNSLKIDSYFASNQKLRIDLRDKSKFVNIQSANASSSYTSIEFYADNGSELIGGQGQNSFNVGKQVGDVKIISGKASDNINFYDYTIDDLADVSITPSSYGGSETISLTFTTGKTVAITGDAEHVNFADSSYVYSHASRTLTKTA